MEWLHPWKPIEESEPGRAEGFERELRRELAPSHALFGVPAAAMGHRRDRDDVLFRLLDGSDRVAVVHLTWTHNPPEQPPWPGSSVFLSLEAWVQQINDHTNWPDHEYLRYLKAEQELYAWILCKIGRFEPAEAMRRAVARFHYEPESERGIITHFGARRIAMADLFGNHCRDPEEFGLAEALEAQTKRFFGE